MRKSSPVCTPARKLLGRKDEKEGEKRKKEEKGGGNAGYYRKREKETCRIHTHSFSVNGNKIR